MPGIADVYQCRVPADTMQQYQAHVKRLKDAIVPPATPSFVSEAQRAEPTTESKVVASVQAELVQEAAAHSAAPLYKLPPPMSRQPVPNSTRYVKLPAQYCCKPYQAASFYAHDQQLMHRHAQQAVMLKSFMKRVHASLDLPWLWINISKFEYQTSLQSRSEQACLARQDLGHTHLAHVVKCVVVDVMIANVSHSQHSILCSAVALSNKQPASLCIAS